MNAIRNSSKLVMLAMILMLSVSGCKSKKKAMEAAAAEKARMEQEAALQKQREEDERKRKEAEAAANKQAESSTNAKYAVLGKYFDAIATSSNVTSANNSISEAMTMFASPETPVLIIISGTGNQKDYDRPTTIQAYLNYLKDQKKNTNKIENLQFDSSGKITEVELRKN